MPVPLPVASKATWNLKAGHCGLRAGEWPGASAWARRRGKSPRRPLMHTARDPADRPRGRRRPSGPPGPVSGMLHVREAGFRSAAVAAGGAVPKYALSAVATYAPPRRAHHHKPAGGMPTPECRGRPPAVHVSRRGRIKRARPGPQACDDRPRSFFDFCLLSRFPRRTCVPHTSRRPHATGQPAVPSAGGRHPDSDVGMCAHDATGRRRIYLVSAYGLMLLLVAGRRR